MRTSKATLAMLAMATGSLHHAAGFAGRDDTSRGWVIKRARDPDVCSAHSRDRLAIRDELGLPRDRHLVGIYGVITTGKSPDLVWEALQQRGIDADLLLAGSLTPEVAAWVETVQPTEHGRVIVREGFLPDDVLDKLVATADAVPLAMTHNGPSGIMGKALAAGVPVVTAGSKVRAKELVATDAGELADLTADSLGRRDRAGPRPRPRRPAPQHGPAGHRRRVRPDPAGRRRLTVPQGGSRVGGELATFCRIDSVPSSPLPRGAGAAAGWAVSWRRSVGSIRYLAHRCSEAPGRQRGGR